MSRESDSDRDEPDSTTDGLQMFRRGLLTAGATGLGLAAAGASSAAAGGGSDAGGKGGAVYNWKQNVDANEHALGNLGALDMAASSAAIEDFQGRNLDVQNGVLNAAGLVDAAGEGYVVPVAKGLTLEDAVDPAETDTPVQDAVDLVAESDSRGQVVLPPGTVEEADEVSLDATIQGWGGMVASTVKFTSTGSDAHGFTVRNKQSYNELRNLQVRGPGSNKTTGTGLLFTGGAPRGINLHNVQFIGWSDGAIYSDTRAFEMNWGKVHVFGCSGDIVRFDQIGPANTWAYAKLNSSSPGYLYFQGASGEMSIGGINTGGAVQGGDDIGPGRFPIAVRASSGKFELGFWNFEPRGYDDSSQQPYGLALLEGTAPKKIGTLRNRTANNIEYLVTLRQGGKDILGPLDVFTSFPNQNRIEVIDPQLPSYYFGSREDVDNKAPTPAVRTLAESGTASVADLSQALGAFDGERRADDGSNTAARGVNCTWDDVNGVWRRPDGSSFNPTVDIDADVVISRFTPDAIDGQRGNLDTIDPALSVDEDFGVFRGSPTIDGANSDVWLTWDDEAFYWYVELADPEHFNDNPWNRLFRGDSIQFGISKGEPGDSDEWLEFDFGLTPSGPKGARRRYPDVVWSEVDGTDIPFDIVRDDSAGVTSYQIKFPWSEIDPEPGDNVLSTSIAIFDFDASGDENAILEWAGGVVGGKDNGAYATALLEE